MCLTRGNKSRKQYEGAARPSRPVLIAPEPRANRYEKPRRAPVVPPNPPTRKLSEAQVKKTLRDAERVESNRQDRRFATSNRNADRIRERVLAKAMEERVRAPPPPPRRAARQEIFVDLDSDSDSHKSAEVAPLNIRKKAPQPPQGQGQQRAARPADLGNTIPALRSTARSVDKIHKHPALDSSAKPVDQSHIHPALRTTKKPEDQSNIHPALRTPARQVEQSHIHPALRTTGNPALQNSVHPAFRTLPTTPVHPQRRVSHSSRPPLQRGIHSHLGKPENYPNSPHDSEVSPLNVTQKLPYSSSRKRR